MVSVNKIKEGIMRRLTRSSSNKMIFGVCGGIGEYLNIDPTIIRLIWLLLIFSGVAVFVYFIAAMIIPLDKNVKKNENCKVNDKWYNEEV